MTKTPLISPVSGASRPDVVAFYCPVWHNYDHGSSWKGEGWCEWDVLRAARPRFKGHYQPYRPTWGCFDESDPKWSAREISLAADNGIDVFAVAWYWYSGVRIMEEALEQGLLRAKNRERMKFAIMWANHDWADYFPAPFGQKWNSWLPSRHSAQDWLRMIDYCIAHYFTQPNYWRVQGDLFYSMFVPLRLVRQIGGAASFRKVLDQTNRRLARAGLPALHLNAMIRRLHEVDELREAGFASTSMYNVISSDKAGKNLIDRYDDVMDRHVQHWVDASAKSLPFAPNVTMGWDVTPRCETTVKWPFPPSPLTNARTYPYVSVVVGNTPKKFQKLCERALQFCLERTPEPNAVFINAWNEWTEGSFLLPEKRYGDAYLKAIRSVFGTRTGRRPALRLTPRIPPPAEHRSGKARVALASRRVRGAADAGSSPLGILPGAQNTA